MWPFEYPYTNFHELNLDWILNEIKNVDAKIANAFRNANVQFASPYIDVFALGVDNTGITDVSSKLAEIIDTAPNGACIFFKEGIYRIDSPIVINKPLAILGCGRGSILNAASGGILVKGNNTLIESLKIQATESSVPYGLKIEGEFEVVSNLTINDSQYGVAFFSQSFVLDSPAQTIINNVVVNDYRISPNRSGRGTAIVCKKCINTIFSNCSAAFKDTLVNVPYASDQASDGIQFCNCNFTVADTGIDIRGGSNFFFSNCVIDQIAKAVDAANGYGVFFANCYFGQNNDFPNENDPIVSLASFNGAQFNTCEFRGNGRTCSAMKFDNSTFVNINGGAVRECQNGIVLQGENENQYYVIDGVTFSNIKSFALQYGNVANVQSKNCMIDSGSLSSTKLGMASVYAEYADAVTIPEVGNITVHIPVKEIGNGGMKYAIPFCKTYGSKSPTLSVYSDSLRDGFLDVRADGDPNTVFRVSAIVFF